MASIVREIDYKYTVQIQKNELQNRANRKQFLIDYENDNSLESAVYSANNPSSRFNMHK